LVLTRLGMFPQQFVLASTYLGDGSFKNFSTNGMRVKGTD